MELKFRLVDAELERGQRSETRRLPDNRQHGHQDKQKKQQSQKQKLLESHRIPIPMRRSCVYMYACWRVRHSTPLHSTAVHFITSSPDRRIQHTAPRSWQSNGQRWTMTFTPFERAKTNMSSTADQRASQIPYIPR